MPTDAQHAGYQEIRRLIDRATRWLVDVRFPITDVAAEIERFGPTRARAGARASRAAARRGAADTLRRRRRGWSALGLPRELALRIWPSCSARSCCWTSSRSPNASEHCRRPRSPSCTSRCPSSSASTRCSPRSPTCRATTAGRPWPAPAMRHDVYAALSAITTSVLQNTDDGSSATTGSRLDLAHAERVERASIDGARGAGPRHGRPGDAVGGAADHARPAELTGGASISARVDRKRAQTCLPRRPRVDAPASRRAPQRLLGPARPGDAGAVLRRSGWVALLSMTP